MFTPFSFLGEALYNTIYRNQVFQFSEFIFLPELHTRETLFAKFKTLTAVCGIVDFWATETLLFRFLLHVSKTILVLQT